jgi:hypothetical protein
MKKALRMALAIAMASAAQAAWGQALERRLVPTDQSLARLFEKAGSFRAGQTLTLEISSSNLQLNVRKHIRKEGGFLGFFRRSVPTVDWNPVDLWQAFPLITLGIQSPPDDTIAPLQQPSVMPQITITRGKDQVLPGGFTQHFFNMRQGAAPNWPGGYLVPGDFHPGTIVGVSNDSAAENSARYNFLQQFMKRGMSRQDPWLLEVELQPPSSQTLADLLDQPFSLLAAMPSAYISAQDSGGSYAFPAQGFNPVDCSQIGDVGNCSFGYVSVQLTGVDSSNRLKYIERELTTRNHSVDNIINNFMDFWSTRKIVCSITPGSHTQQKTCSVQTDPVMAATLGTALGKQVAFNKGLTEGDRLRLYEAGTKLAPDDVEMGTGYVKALINSKSLQAAQEQANRILKVAQAEFEKAKLEDKARRWKDYAIAARSYADVMPRLRAGVLAADVLASGQVLLQVAREFEKLERDGLIPAQEEMNYLRERAALIADHGHVLMRTRRVEDLALARRQFGQAFASLPIELPGFVAASAEESKILLLVKANRFRSNAGEFVQQVFRPPVWGQAEMLVPGLPIEQSSSPNSAFQASLFAARIGVEVTPGPGPIKKRWQWSFRGSRMESQWSCTAFLDVDVSELAFAQALGTEEKWLVGFRGAGGRGLRLLKRDAGQCIIEPLQDTAGGPIEIDWAGRPNSAKLDEPPIAIRPVNPSKFDDYWLAWTDRATGDVRIANLVGQRFAAVETREVFNRYRKVPPDDPPAGWKQEECVFRSGGAIPPSQLWFTTVLRNPTTEVSDPKFAQRADGCATPGDPADKRAVCDRVIAWSPANWAKDRSTLWTNLAPARVAYGARRSGDDAPLVAEKIKQSNVPPLLWITESRREVDDAQKKFVTIAGAAVLEGTFVPKGKENIRECEGGEGASGGDAWQAATGDPVTSSYAKRTSLTTAVIELNQGVPIEGTDSFGRIAFFNADSMAEGYLPILREAATPSKLSLWPFGLKKLSLNIPAPWGKCAGDGTLEIACYESAFDLEDPATTTEHDGIPVSAPLPAMVAASEAIESKDVPYVTFSWLQKKGATLGLAVRRLARLDGLPSNVKVTENPKSAFSKVFHGSHTVPGVTEASSRMLVQRPDPSGSKSGAWVTVVTRPKWNIETEARTNSGRLLARFSPFDLETAEDTLSLLAESRVKEPELSLIHTGKVSRNSVSIGPCAGPDCDSAMKPTHPKPVSLAVDLVANAEDQNQQSDRDRSARTTLAPRKEGTNDKWVDEILAAMDGHDFVLARNRPGQQTADGLWLISQAKFSGEKGKYRNVTFLAIKRSKAQTAEIEIKPSPTCRMPVQDYQIAQVLAIIPRIVRPNRPVGLGLMTEKCEDLAIVVANNLVQSGSINLEVFALEEGQPLTAIDEVPGAVFWVPESVRRLTDEPLVIPQVTQFPDPRVELPLIYFDASDRLLIEWNQVVQDASTERGMICLQPSQDKRFKPCPMTTLNGYRLLTKAQPADKFELGSSFNAPRLATIDPLAKRFVMTRSRSILNGEGTKSGLSVHVCDGGPLQADERFTVPRLLGSHVAALDRRATITTLGGRSFVWTAVAPEDGGLKVGVEPVCDATAWKGSP